MAGPWAPGAGPLAAPYLAGIGSEAEEEIKEAPNRRGRCYTDTIRYRRASDGRVTELTMRLQFESHAVSEGSPVALQFDASCADVEGMPEPLCFCHVSALVAQLVSSTGSCRLQTLYERRDAMGASAPRIRELHQIIEVELCHDPANVNHDDDYLLIDLCSCAPFLAPAELPPNPVQRVPIMPGRIR